MIDLSDVFKIRMDTPDGHGLGLKVALTPEQIQALEAFTRDHRGSKVALLRLVTAVSPDQPDIEHLGPVNG